MGKKISSFILVFVFLFSSILGCQVSAVSTKGKDSLSFDGKKYTVKTVTIGEKTMKVRAYENILYVKKPIDTKYQTMNIYIPEEYFNGGSIHGYTAKTAPIFFPNTIGGYMPGAAGTINETPPVALPTNGEKPAVGQTGGAPNNGQDAALYALSRGYVVAEAGARGRTLKNEAGEYTGKAPAAIVDLKAAVRYLRYNDKKIPGNAERIISDGTSAGGAISALLGATGNSKDYEPYLKALGAANTRDDIYATMAYCPITNLDNADMAYEWQFNGMNSYRSMKISFENGQIQRSETNNEMTTDQIKLSMELKNLFPAYVNGLKLKNEKGELLTMDPEGSGSLKELVKSYIIDSAQKALDNGISLKEFDWIKVENGKVTEINWEGYNKYIGRMKATPAFDGVDLGTGENNEFGTAAVDNLHFTKYSQDRDTSGKPGMASSKIIKMMNPMEYIGAKTAKTAKYWRIRYGANDNNTSLAIEVILATTLKNKGYDVDFSVPWGIGHAGDYDLEALFDWADGVCKLK